MGLCLERGASTSVTVGAEALWFHTFLAWLAAGQAALIDDVNVVRLGQHKQYAENCGVDG